MPSGRRIRTVHHIDHFTTPELAACHGRANVEPYAHPCVSRAVADELAAGWGIKADVIPNGVAYERFANTDPATRVTWREKLGRYVLAVGGIEPRKGSLDLIEAYALLRAPPGYGGYQPRDRWRRDALRLPRLPGPLGRTRANSACGPIVLGPVPDDALPPLVAAAGGFAFPSVKEGSATLPSTASEGNRPL